MINVNVFIKSGDDLRSQINSGCGVHAAGRLTTQAGWWLHRPRLPEASK